MILLEVSNNLARAYFPLVLNAACIASERRYPNHSRGEMHQVSLSRFLGVANRDPDRFDAFPGHLRLTSSLSILTMLDFISQPQIGKRNYCYP
jgi:hypothetical protein